MKKLGLIFVLALVGLFGCSTSSTQTTGVVGAASEVEYKHKYKIISYDVADTHGIVKVYATINVGGTLQVLDLNEAYDDIYMDENVNVIEGSFLNSNMSFKEITEEKNLSTKIYYRITRE